MNWNELAIEYALRSGVLLFAVLVLIGLARLGSLTAAQRHTIGMLGVVFALAMPIFLLSSWRWGILPSQEYPTAFTAPSMKVDNNILIPQAHVQPAVVAAGLDTDVVFPEARKENLRIFSVVLFIWMAGAACYLMFSILGFCALWRMKKTSQQVPLGIQKIINKISIEQNHSRKISLIVSPHVSSPVMWGVFSPVIALPSEAGDWSDEQIRLVLLHELAHISRKDGAALVLRRCLLALHWFNPLAWLLCRQLESLAEEACDGLVLRNGTTSTKYAELLFSIAKGRQSNWALPIAVSGTQTLETRIKMIIKEPSKLVAQSRSIVSGSIYCGLSALAFSVATLAFAVDEGASQLDRKLEETVIPRINLADAPLGDAFNFIVDRSRELDKVAKKPAEKGINIVMLGDLSDKKVSLNINNVPVGESIQLIADLADVDLQKRGHVMIIRDPEKKKQTILVDPGSEVIQEKLNNIILPHIDFSNTPVKQAFDFIRGRSAELDLESPAAAKGINIVLKSGDDDRRVTLRLGNVPIGELISITAEAAGYDINVRKNVVLVARDLKKDK